MAVDNADIARVFAEIADLLEIQGDNPFRIRAYRNAANLVSGLGAPVTAMLAQGEDLTELPGIGADLAAKMREIVDTSTCAVLEKLRKKLPPTLTTLLRIPGLGPKRVQTLYRRLDIGTPEQLYAAAHDGRIRELPGFGEKTEAAILQALERQVQKKTRVALVAAARHAEPLRAYLARVPGVNQVVIAGSYRRRKETVGDIDIVVTAKRGSPVMDRFCRYRDVAQVVSKGTTRATVKLGGGLQVDVRVVPQVSFGAALYYFTGSKAHNIAIRRIAQQKRLKVNEYGVFRGAKRIAGGTEESVFRTAGLPYIPPELRENRGEIEAARAGRLPRLIAPADIKGDLHVRTPATGGRDTLRDMAAAARACGLEYVAIAERVRRDIPRLRRQFEAIDRLNETLKGIALLKGVEVDILENGDLDLAHAAPGDLDLVIAAVHDTLDLPRARQTERILRALEHPRLTVLAMPGTGSGTGYDIDMPRVIRKARERGCFLELSAHPDRVPLLEIDCRMAKDEGVLVAVSADARGTGDFADLAYGVGQARRGWLEAKDILNARPLAELRALIKRT